MKSIPQDILQEITHRLVAEFQPEQIFLFGSQAWGSRMKTATLILW